MHHGPLRFFVKQYADTRLPQRITVCLSVAITQVLLSNRLIRIFVRSKIKRLWSVWVKIGLDCLIYLNADETTLKLSGTT